MKMVNISTLKNELSKYLKYVQLGEKIRVLDRNEIVADIVPVSKLEKNHEQAFLQTLETKGIVRRGSGEIPKEIEMLPKGATKRKISGVLDLLLSERKEGR